MTKTTPKEIEKTSQTICFWKCWIAQHWIRVKKNPTRLRSRRLLLWVAPDCVWLQLSVPSCYWQNLLFGSKMCKVSKWQEAARGCSGTDLDCTWQYLAAQLFRRILFFFFFSKSQNSYRVTSINFAEDSLMSSKINVALIVEIHLEQNEKFGCHEQPPIHEVPPACEQPANATETKRKPTWCPSMLITSDYESSRKDENEKYSLIHTSVAC